TRGATMRRLLNWLVSPARKRRAPTARRVQLELEPLENRQLLSTLSPVRDATGAPNVFAIAPDHQVYKQTPTGYTLTQPGPVLDLDTTQNNLNSPVVFTLGADHQVYIQTSTGYSLTNAGQVLSFVAARDAAGNPLIFAIGVDHQVYQQTPNGYVLTNAGQVLAMDVTNNAAGAPT